MKSEKKITILVGNRQDFYDYFAQVKGVFFEKTEDILSALRRGKVETKDELFLQVNQFKQVLGLRFDEVIYLDSARDLKDFEEIHQRIEMKKRSKKITKQHLVDKSTELLNDFLEFKKRKTDPLVEISPQDDYLLGEMKKNLVDFTFYLNDYEEGVESE